MTLTVHRLSPSAPHQECWSPWAFSLSLQTSAALQQDQRKTLFVVGNNIRMTHEGTQRLFLQITLKPFISKWPNFRGFCDLHILLKSLEAPRPSIVPGKKTRLLQQLLKYRSFMFNTWVSSTTAVEYSKQRDKSVEVSHKYTDWSLASAFSKHVDLINVQNRKTPQLLQWYCTGWPPIHTQLQEGKWMVTVLGELGGDWEHRTEHSLTAGRGQSTLRLICQDTSLLHEPGHVRPCNKGCSWLAGVGRYAGCDHVPLCTGIPFS